MNTTQTQTTSAVMVGIVAGFLAGRGIFGFDTATWTAILSGAVGLALVIYTAVITRKPALVSNVAAMPEVSSITLDKTAPGTATLDSATPNNVVTK